MSSDGEVEVRTYPAADPFLTKLRALRDSLPGSAREVRYRLEEMERRLLLLEPSTDPPIDKT